MDTGSLRDSALSPSLSAGQSHSQAQARNQGHRMGAPQRGEKPWGHELGLSQPHRGLFTGGGERGAEMFPGGPWGGTGPAR